ncbi:A disintegrin and metalloproteinase with thrombospondin motifs 13-like [Amphiura filiformis]|uniref:A disintegrin and metalloproteinase with thrombospondin motifs 13-like n=1 Tax=Amphiura filiformis TaxID=82378 RepID=UPI003B222081
MLVASSIIHPSLISVRCSKDAHRDRNQDWRVAQHGLGLNHDSDYGCQTGVNIMSANSASGAGSFEWSSCSRTNIRNFLDNPSSSCLMDKPFIEAVPVDVLSGVSPNAQCELQFGPGFSATEPIDCGLLECKHGISTNKGTPPMEGTPCADKKWCISGKCVYNEGLPDPVDGAWSSWETDQSPCSKTCGRGVQQLRKRLCNNPLPMNDGKECPGDSIEYEICNIEPCDKSQDDFRDEQCAATNNEPYKGQYYKWIGFVTGQSGDALCDHKCGPDGALWGRNRPPYQFIDGTQCWDDENADSNIIKLCVAGSCMEFGCDGKRHSNLVFDSCGVCGGDGSSCQKIENSFSGGDRKDEYVTFLTLPIGATNLRITNTNPHFTFMMAKVGGIRVLKGNSTVTDRYSADDMIIRRNKNRLEETIAVDGPTTELVEFEVYLRYDPNKYGNVNPMIQYQYYVPETGPGPIGPGPTVPVSCDGITTELVPAVDGKITRFGPTPNGRICKHAIVAPPGKDVVAFVSLVNIDCSQGEFVLIRDIDDYYNPYRYCGDNPWLRPKREVLADKVLWIEHKATKAGHGYEALYHNSYNSPDDTSKGRQNNVSDKLLLLFIYSNISLSQINILFTLL